MDSAKIESAHRSAVSDNVPKVPTVTFEYALMGLVLVLAAFDSDIRAFSIVVKSATVRRFHIAIA